MSDSETNAAIYTLYGDCDLKADIIEEQQWRQTLKLSGGSPRDPIKSSGNNSTGVDFEDTMDNKVPHRIRIRSPVIMTQLFKLAPVGAGGLQDRSSPHHDTMFFRAFRSLIHLHPQMRKIQEEFRSKWAGLGETSSEHATETKTEADSSGGGAAGDYLDLLNSP